MHFFFSLLIAVFRMIIVSWRSMHYVFLCVINGVLTFQANWNSILIGIGVSKSIIS